VRSLIWLLVVTVACKDRAYDSDQRLRRINEIPIQHAFVARCAIATTSAAAMSFDNLLRESLAMSCPRGTPWTVTSLLLRCNDDHRYLRWVFCDGATADYLVDNLLRGPRRTQ
jgi:hypothetical protein